MQRIQFASRSLVQVSTKFSDGALVETNTNTLREPATNEVSFIRGGPFFRLQLTLRLIGPNQWNFTRRILILIAIGWLPLLMITLRLIRKDYHHSSEEYRAHARLLIAVPALLIGEGIFDFAA
jgi:hypothetical protein